MHYFRVVANYVMWRFIRHRLNNLDERFQGVQQKLYRYLTNTALA
jgi:membrane metallo-endopeptidase-like protein 1